VQVQQTHPHPALAEALARFSTCVCGIAATMPEQKLHQLRHPVARLVRAVVCVARSPQPLLPGAQRDASQTTSVAARVASIVCCAADAAAPALDSALRSIRTAADSDEDVDGMAPDARASGASEAGSARASTRSRSARSNGAAPLDAGAAANISDRQPRVDADPAAAREAAIVAAEPAIGWYVALLDKFVRQDETISFCRDFALAGAPWALSLQALQHTELQAVTDDAPALVRQRRSPSGEVAPRLAVLERGLGDGAWQVRADAVALLQGFWYRCGFAPPLCPT
jgi:hypothetical protein